MEITVTIDSDDIILGLEVMEFDDKQEYGPGDHDQWEDVKIEATVRFANLVKQALHKRVVG